MKNVYQILIMLLSIVSQANDSIQVNNVSPTILLLPEVASLSNCHPSGVVEIQNIGNSQGVPQVFKRMILKEKWPQSFVVKPLRKSGRVRCGFFYQSGKSEEFTVELNKSERTPIIKAGTKGEVSTSDYEIDDFSLFREVVKTGEISGFHDVSTEKITSKIIEKKKYRYRILKILTNFSNTRIFLFEVNESVKDIELNVGSKSVDRVRSSIVIQGKASSLLVVSANRDTSAKEVLDALL